MDIFKMTKSFPLENNDWEAVRKDLNDRPIENIDAKASNEEIIKILDKYGISLIQNSTFRIQHSSNGSLKLWGTGSPRRNL